MNLAISWLRRVLHRVGTQIRQLFDLEGSGELVVLSGLVGAFAGLVAIAFVWALGIGTHWIQRDLMNYFPPTAGKETGAQPTLDVTVWAILLFPTLGGLLSGWLVFTFCPEAEGHGSDAMVRSFHRQQGNIRTRVPLIKALASVITISSGGSAGREGPIAQVGAGLASILARFFDLNSDQKRFLMLAGAAGGISAVFQSPLGAALFVCEVLYASAAIEMSALFYATISSVSAYVVFTALHGTEHEIIAAKGMHFGGASEMPAYVLFAIICAVVGWGYVKVFYGLRNHFFRRLKIPAMFKPAIGGFLLGIMILIMRIPGVTPNGMPHVMGGGYGWIQQALDGEVKLWYFFALLAGVKILATSLTISSGGSGGVFAPSLFIGAMVGGAYGWAGAYFLPDLFPDPQVFVLVGMGAFFAAVAKVPLTATVMVSEMTNTFSLLMPLMFVSVLANALLSRRTSLYEEQVHAPIDSPVHFGDFIIDVLANLRVEDVADTKRNLLTFCDSTPLPRILQQIANAEGSYFPVLDAEGNFKGVFSLSDLRSVLQGETAGRLVLAEDIATTNVLSVSPHDDLHTALRRFTAKNLEELPIVDPSDSSRLLGMLRRKELIAAYHQEIERMQSHGTAAGR